MADLYDDVSTDERIRWLFEAGVAKAEQEQGSSRPSTHRNFNIVERDGYFAAACNASSPDWFRLANLCYAEMDWNGHYSVNKADVMKFLGVGDVRNLRRSIKRAVEYGALADGSDVQCLKAPAHVTTKSPNASRRSCIRDH